MKISSAQMTALHQLELAEANSKGDMAHMYKTMHAKTQEALRGMGLIEVINFEFLSTGLRLTEKGREIIASCQAGM